MPTIVVIKPDQSVTKIVPANGKKLSLEEMQKAVGGYIQRVTFKGQDIVFNGTRYSSGEMYVDEDGIAKDLPVNLKVALFFGGIKILGNALVLFRKGKPVEAVKVFAGTKPEDRADQNLPFALRTRPFALKFDINGNIIKE